MKFFIFLLFTFICFSIAEPIVVHGVVYSDLNSDGQRNEDEPGIPGVLVSNSKDVVVTNERGEYTLTLEENCTVFITKPANYKTRISPFKIPQFYFHYQKEDSKLYFRGIPHTKTIPHSLDFPLYPCKENENFDILVVADPQPETAQELDYIRQDLIEEVITDPSNLSFGLVLGDVMFDRLDLLNYYVPLLSVMPFPMYHVIGNHDVNYDALDDEHSDETFKRWFGPTSFSFDYAKIHFILLDSIFHFRDPQTGQPKYEARVTEKQLQWLKNDLAHVDKEKLIVIATHAPFFTTTDKSVKGTIQNKNEVLSLLSDYKVLSLAGHTHHQYQQWITSKKDWKGKTPFHQIICTTLCGSWWAGPQDSRGVPDSTQQDGVPNGYYIFSFQGTEYTYRFKASGKPESYQMQIHAPNGIVSIDESDKEKVLVLEFEHTDKSQAYYSLDGQEFQPLKSTYATDPMASILLDSNKLNKKIWVHSQKTRNLWTAPLPKLSIGAHRIIVKIVDQFGRTFQSCKIFWVM